MTVFITYYYVRIITINSSIELTFSAQVLNLRIEYVCNKVLNKQTNLILNLTIRLYVKYVKYLNYLS